MWLQAQSLAGLVAIPVIAWVLSERRGVIKPARLVRSLIAGIGLQVLIAGLMLNVPAARTAKEFAASIQKDAAIWQCLAKVTDLKDK